MSEASLSLRAIDKCQLTAQSLGGDEALRPSTIVVRTPSPAVGRALRGRCPAAGSQWGSADARTCLKNANVRILRQVYERARRRLSAGEGLSSAELFGDLVAAILGYSPAAFRRLAQYCFMRSLAAFRAAADIGRRPRCRVASGSDPPVSIAVVRSDGTV